MKKTVFILMIIMFSIVSISCKKHKEIKNLENYIENCERSLKIDEARFEIILDAVRYGGDTTGATETVRNLDIGRKNLREAQIELSNLKNK